jgi:hypothetical protein
VKPKNFEQTAVALAKAALNAQQVIAPPKPPAPSTRKPRVSTGRAMLLGAALMFAGEAFVKSRGREVLDSVRHGLAGKIDSQDGDELDADGDEEDFAEQPDAEDFDAEPEGEEDQDPDQDDDEDEGPARRRPRRKAASGRIQS